MGYEDGPFELQELGPLALGQAGVVGVLGQSGLSGTTVGY